MTPAQMITLVRKLINDEQATGFASGGNLEDPESTEELYHYLDRAVDEYSKRQAAQNDLRLVKTLTLTGNTAAIPNDFLKFCGAVPLDITNKTLTYYGEASNLPIKYFARLPYVTEYGENQALPYDRDAEITIATLAAIYALNQYEFDVSQDLLLLGYGANTNGQT